MYKIKTFSISAFQCCSVGRKRQNHVTCLIILVSLVLGFVFGAIFSCKLNANPDTNFVASVGNKNWFSGNVPHSFIEKSAGDDKKSDKQLSLQETVSRSVANIRIKSTCNTYWIVAVEFSENMLETARKLPSWCVLIVSEHEKKLQEPPSNMFYLLPETQNELAEKSRFFGAALNSKQNKQTRRKNLGYLWAILHGAAIVWDFDSNNKLLVDQSSLFHFLSEDIEQALTVPNYNDTLINPYHFFATNSSSIWPRGFSSKSIKELEIQSTKFYTQRGTWPGKNIGIVHSLTNGYADVISSTQSKATTNIVLSIAKFSKDPKIDVKLVISRRTFSPYNNHATVHLRSTLWALLLPVTVPHPISDIWRSYIMQRLMWDVGLQVMIAGPYVSKDMMSTNNVDSEQDGCYKCDELLQVLNEWSSSKPSLVARIMDLYAVLHDKKLLDKDDVHLAQLWLEELKLYGYGFPNVVPKLTLAVRTFSGHLPRMNERYFSTVNMFIDRRVIDVLIVLDDESEADHKLGECLKRYNYSVKYEALPAFAKRTQLKGYDRQQWSTFYMDYLSNSDYIGVIDSDGMVYSFMHPFYSIFASEDDKRVMLKPMAGDHYAEDKLALKFDSGLDFMWTNRMPMWYRWETFQNLRNYIASVWNVSHFDDAFIEFSRNQRYSQFSIISSYANQFEPNYYRVIMNTDPRGAVTVGSNRGRELDIHVGCCRTFNLACNQTVDAKLFEDHLLRFDNSEFVVVNATAKTDAYYEHVHAYLSGMPSHTVAQMKANCETYMHRKSTPICIK